jgi:hypothetical protein
LLAFDESCEWDEEETWVEEPRPSIAAAETSKAGFVG